MKTLEEVLVLMESRIDQPTLEFFIERQWLRPVTDEEGWYFDEIDIARLKLVCHLTQDIAVNDEGMDVVLSLLDQLYGMRSHIHTLAYAIAQQSPEVRTDIMMVIKEHYHPQ